MIRSTMPVKIKEKINEFSFMRTWKDLFLDSDVSIPDIDFGFRCPGI
jgi:hypothetical protein